jgi:hypothetical protein
MPHRYAHAIESHTRNRVASQQFGDKIDQPTSVRSADGSANGNGVG